MSETTYQRTVTSPRIATENDINMLRAEYNRKVAEAERKAQANAQKVMNEQLCNFQKKFQDQLAQQNNNLRGELRQQDRAQREQLARTANAIYNDVRKMHNETITNCENRIQQESNRMGARIDDLKKRTDIRINNISNTIQELSQNVEQEFQRIEKEIRTTDETVGKILTRIQNEDQRCKEAVDLVRSLLRDTIAQINIDRWCPNEASDIRGRIEFLENRQINRDSTAIAADIEYRLQRAKVKAVYRKAEYDCLLAETIAQAQTTLEFIEANATLNMINDKEQDTVEYWTRGKVIPIIHEISNLQHELQSDPTKERIKEILLRIVALHEQMTELIKTAHIKAKKSEDCLNTIGDIITILQDQGCIVNDNDCDFISNDLREGTFVVPVDNLNGIRATICVVPNDDGSESLITDIPEIGINGEELTDRQRDQFNEKLDGSLTSKGYNVGTSTPINDRRGNCLQDLSTSAELKQEGAAKKLNERIKQHA